MTPEAAGAPAIGRPPVVRHCFTDRSHGDLSVHLPHEVLERRRAAIAPTPWTWLEQVHANRVVVVEAPGDHAGAHADAAVTTAIGATLAVHTADCAGVLLRARTDRGSVIGATHAGWRGLESGVLQATVAAMVALGAHQVTWRLGPCISASSYEFGETELARLADRYGPSVAASTTSGAPALDLRAGVAVALTEVGAVPETPDPLAVRCTASDPAFFSWRAGRDPERQAAVTWIEAG